MNFLRAEVATELQWPAAAVLDTDISAVLLG